MNNVNEKVFIEATILGDTIVSMLTSIGIPLMISAVFFVMGFAKLDEIHSITKAVDAATEVSNFSEIVKGQENNEIHYGRFLITTKHPISEEAWSVPSCLAYKVSHTERYRSGKHWRTKEVVTQEEYAPNVMLNTEATDLKTLVQYTERSPWVSLGSNGENNVYYLPEDQNYLVAYLGERQGYYIGLDTGLELTEIFDQTEDIQSMHLLFGVGGFLVFLAILFGILTWTSRIKLNKGKNDMA